MSKTITLRGAPVHIGIAGLAAVAGVASFWLADASPGLALIVAVASAGLTWMALELRERRAKIERLEDAIERLARHLDRASAHLGTLDDRTRDIEEWIARDARPGVEQSAADVEMLGTLVKELAVTLAHHDAELGGPAPAASTSPPAPAASVKVGAGAAPAPAFPSPSATSRPPRSAVPDPAGVESQRVAAAINRAIAEGEFELHLQPIVSLPQRRVKFYEAFPRLRSADGELVPHEHGLTLANASGRRAALDIAALRRVAAATRRLVSRNRDASIFLRISERTCADMDQLASALHGVQDLSNHIVVVLSQQLIRTLGASGMAKLQPILALGFSLGMDDVLDLRLDPRMLFDHGVRYVKASAAVLMADARRAPSEIHPQDLSRLLARNGIQLIAADIDLEKTVIEALDLDVRFGQGAAFSPPRPLRPEVLEPAAPQEPVTPSEPAANDAPPAAPPRTPYRSTLRRA